MTMEDDIKAMEDSLESIEEPKDENWTEAPGTNDPGTEAPTTESSRTEIPETEAPETSAPTTEAPEEDPRDAELRALRKENEKLKQSKTTGAPPTSAPSTDAPLEDVDFLGSDVDMDEITRSPEVFNKLLNSVYKRGREDAKADIRNSGESIVKSMPDIVKNNITIVNAMAKMKEEFYDENKDLVGKEELVAQTFERVSIEGKSYKDNLEATAKEVRRLTGLKKEANKENKPPPKLPKKKGGLRQKPKPDSSGLQKDMDEMDKALGLND